MLSLPNLKVQGYIYRNLIQRPKVNRFLNQFGGALNRLGLPYATGLTRHKATLFASKIPDEVDAAGSALLLAGRQRAKWAVAIKILSDNFDPLSWSFIKPVQGAIKKTIELVPSDQIVGFLGELVERCEFSTPWALKALPTALEKLSLEQIVALFSEIVWRYTEEHTPVAAGAFYALPAVLRSNLSPKQILELFDIFDRQRKWQRKSSLVDPFYALPEELEKVKDLNPDEIIAHFKEVIIFRQRP